MEAALRREIKPWPPSAWNFPLLTLAAFYYNPDLDVARAEWGVTQAGILTAGESPNLGLILNPAYVTNAALYGFSPWILGFIFDVPFETAGKKDARVDQAQHLSDAARLKIASAAWRARSRLRSKLLDLYAAGRSETFLENEKSDLEKYVALLKGLSNSPAEPSLLLLQAETLLEKTDLFLSEARQKKTEAHVSLAQAIGIPASALEEAAVSFDDLTGPLPDEISLGEAKEKALVNRSDILSALEVYEASQDALKVEIAKQFPDFHLGPGYTWNQGQDQWSLGISLTLPLFNQNQGPIAQAEANRKVEAARFRALQDSVIADIDRARVGYEGVLEKLKQAEKLLALQEKKQKWIEEMGSSSYIQRSTLLQTRQEILEAQKARLDAYVEAQSTLGLLEDALERPLESTENIPDVSTNPRDEDKK